MDAKTKEAIDLLRTLDRNALPVARRKPHGRPHLRLPGGTRRGTRKTAQQRFRPLRRLRPGAPDAAPELPPRHGTPRSQLHPRPVCPDRRRRPPLRPGEQRRRGFGGEPHADFPDAAHTPPAVQPPAGAFGRRGVHGRARYAHPAAAAGTDRHGNRGRAHGDAGRRRRTGAGRPRLRRPAAKAAMRPATRASTRSISHSTTSPACATSASTAAPTCWAPSASP